MRHAISFTAILVAGCSGQPVGQAGNDAASINSVAVPANDAGPQANDLAEAPLTPPAPGTPGGLPDDRTSVSETPFAETSAQGAAAVLQSYFALAEQGRYGEAYRLWSDDGRASGLDEAAFARGFARYREYHANIGAPGEIEGAAGSLYVEVPVLVYGRDRDGAEFSQRGTATLRRVNDVPGSTAAQRRWHIARIELPPA